MGGPYGQSMGVVAALGSEHRDKDMADDDSRTEGWLEGNFDDDGGRHSDSWTR